MADLASLSMLFNTPQPDATNQYNTQLTPTGQMLFGQQMGSRTGDLADYDLRGAWAQQGGGPAGAGHMPDTFKKPNHPTFSAGSMYAGGDNQAGTWTQLPGPDAQWVFVPGSANQANFGQANLQRYFDAREPGNLLVDPSAVSR
jgi:hypothetical protein